MVPPPLSAYFYCGGCIYASLPPCYRSVPKKVKSPFLPSLFLVDSIMFSVKESDHRVWVNDYFLTAI